MANVTVKRGQGTFGQKILVGAHELVSDVSPALGGEDQGPEPHALLLSALGSCTAITVSMYARRKGWNLTDVQVELKDEKVGEENVLTRTVTLSGELDPEQREKLMSIANACPVHKLLTGKIRVETRAASGA